MSVLVLIFNIALINKLMKSYDIIKSHYSLPQKMVQKNSFEFFVSRFK